MRLPFATAGLVIMMTAAITEARADRNQLIERFDELAAQQVESAVAKPGDNLMGTALADDLYGIAYQAGKGYDFSTMQINAFIWQHGADIWDETKEPDGKALGVVNSPEAVKALQHYLSLLEYMPPVVQTGSSTPDSNPSWKGKPAVGGGLRVTTWVAVTRFVPLVAVTVTVFRPGMSQVKAAESSRSPLLILTACSVARQT